MKTFIKEHIVQILVGLFFVFLFLATWFDEPGYYPAPDSQTNPWIYML